MAGGISKWEERYTALRARTAGLRARVDDEAKEVQGIAVEATAAFVFGSMEAEARSSSRPLATVGDLPPALTWGAAAYAAGRAVGGRGGELLQSAGRGLVVGFAYRKGYEGR